jgi:Prasinovirus endonuclease VII
MRRRYWDDPEKARSYAREWYTRNREQLRAKSLAYWRSHREEILAKHRAQRREAARNRPPRVKLSVEERKTRKRAYYEKNRERTLAQVRGYRNRPEIREKVRERRRKNHDTVLRWKRDSYRRNRERILAQQKALRQNQAPDEKVKRVAWHRAYYGSNRERIRQMQKEYRRRNLKRDNLARVIKRRTNVQFALRCRIRNHARKILLRLPSSASRSDYLDLLGCTLSEFTSHLESKFLPGMSWENRNLWHLDHIRPLKTFDLSDPTQLAIACHFTNLQPLWAVDNLRKGHRWPRQGDKKEGERMGN